NKNVKHPTQQSSSSTTNLKSNSNTLSACISGSGSPNDPITSKTPPPLPTVPPPPLPLVLNTPEMIVVNPSTIIKTNITSLLDHNQDDDDPLYDVINMDRNHQNNGNYNCDMNNIETNDDHRSIVDNNDNYENNDDDSDHEDFHNNNFHHNDGSIIIDVERDADQQDDNGCDQHFVLYFLVK
ncbi:hypothetical protein BLA29_011276, partial [Euroglyphus maynei]